MNVADLKKAGDLQARRTNLLANLAKLNEHRVTGFNISVNGNSNAAGGPEQVTGLFNVIGVSADAVGAAIITELKAVEAEMMDIGVTDLNLKKQ